MLLKFGIDLGNAIITNRYEILCINENYHHNKYDSINI